MTYLVHHGVLGMKWGVRRYQNRDGSLTPLGRRHQKDNGWDPESKAKGTSVEKKVVKSHKDMTDDELRTALNRARMEKDYLQAIRDSKVLMKELNPKHTSAGEKFIKTFVKDAAVSVGKDIVKYQMKSLAKEAGLLGDDQQKKKKKETK